MLDALFLLLDANNALLRSCAGSLAQLALGTTNSRATDSCGTGSSTLRCLFVYLLFKCLHQLNALLEVAARIKLEGLLC
jgi:hypothetical protein